MGSAQKQAVETQNRKLVAKSTFKEKKKAQNRKLVEQKSALEEMIRTLTQRIEKQERSISAQDKKFKAAGAFLTAKRRRLASTGSTPIPPRRSKLPSKRRRLRSVA